MAGQADPNKSSSTSSSSSSYRKYRAPGILYSNTGERPRPQSPEWAEVSKRIPFIDFAGRNAYDYEYDNKGMIVGVAPKLTGGANIADTEAAAKTDTLAELLNPTGTGSRLKKGKKTINDAYASLMAFLTQQQNPWSNLKAQHTSVDPQLQQLLQSQGVDTTPTQQFASMLNTQGQGQADAFQNLINILGGTYEESRNASKANAKYDQAVALANLVKALGG